MIAVEANPVYQECLRMTFAKEISEGRLALVGQPVWSEPAEVHFAGGGLVGAIADNGAEMRATTVDEIADTLQLPYVSFIKADIEGAERHALKGASKTCTTWHPHIAFCVYHYPDDPAVIGSILDGMFPDRKPVFDTSGRYVYC